LATSAVASVDPSSTTSTATSGSPAPSSSRTAEMFSSSFQAGMNTSVSVTLPTLDDVSFRACGRPGEALDGEGRDVDEGLASEDEVADDLSDSGALEEAVPGEAGCVQETARLRRLADQGVVVGRHLVVALPASGEPHLGKLWAPALGNLEDPLE